jgi:hypothetical protein
LVKMFLLVPLFLVQALLIVIFDGCDITLAKSFSLVVGPSDFKLV